MIGLIVSALATIILMLAPIIGLITLVGIIYIVVYLINYNIRKALSENDK